MTDQQITFALSLIRDLYQADDRLDQEFSTSDDDMCADSNQIKRLKELARLTDYPVGMLTEWLKDLK